MTNRDCIKWMEEKGILHHWIRPVLGLNDEIIINENEENERRSTAYHGRPVGDCQEMMPLDNSLFQDFKCSYDNHVTLAYQLPCTGPLRISRATPKHIENAVRRIWGSATGVSPPPHRIV